jgi:hypothetical protein
MSYRPEPAHDVSKGTTAMKKALKMMLVMVEWTAAEHTKFGNAAGGSVVQRPFITAAATPATRPCVSARGGEGFLPERL